MIQDYEYDAPTLRMQLFRSFCFSGLNYFHAFIFMLDRRYLYDESLYKDLCLKS